MRVLFIDNFDSFTFNLVDEFARRGCQVETHRNSVSASRVLDRLDQAGEPALIVLSPGPGHPREAGCCMELIQKTQGRYPLFGVCLGHQALVEACGGEVGPTGKVVHGKSSLVNHTGKNLFENLPNPLQVARYHSLSAQRVPENLRVTATTDEIVMAVEHVSFPYFGVQFHPESILTPRGGLLIDRLIQLAGGAA
ncbi:MAG: aminodeoxychorismate/anthranilate synthase component II [Acidobacteria bacterium]|nr:aminodeoxychorismate/anthranilate synthase component II [Acidobacteriota bacterium]